MNPPRLAVLLGTHQAAQALLPVLQQSRFALTHHCLQASQLHEAVEAGTIDVALVSTGPRGLDQPALARLSRRHISLVVLDNQPHHPRWASFDGVVLHTSAPADLVLSGLDAALAGQRLRQPIDRPVEVQTPVATVPVDQAGPGVPLREVADAGGTILSVVGGHGAPGRSTVAVSLAALLGRVADVALVDLDFGAPILAARLGANTNKNLVTVAHLGPSTPDEWTAALGRDLQPIDRDDCPRGVFLAGLPRTDARVHDGFVHECLEALRVRFDYVICDTGVQWLDGDRTARVPLEHADLLLLVATPDVGGIRRAWQALERVRTGLGPARIGVVVNQHRSRMDFDRWELEYALGEPLSAVLPFDPDACWHAVEHKRPVVLAQQRSAIARALLQFAERLRGGHIELPRPTRPERRWSRLLRLGGRAS